tara:strand:- start:126 stop:323 length:198 start_codon:yes stop_codon:yes gene_type:complete
MSKSSKFAKSTKNKNPYININNSFLYNKNLKNVRPEKKNIGIYEKKRIEFHESHSNYGHVLKPFD